MQNLISPVLLHAHSIQRNCARIVLYSTLNSAGLNVTHIYHLQGLEKLRFFFTHIRRGDTTGDLMMISLLYTQLELGISKKIMETQHDDYSEYITPTWLTNLWSYCTKCGVNINMINQHMYHLPRVNDFFLMDVVYKEVANVEHVHIFNHVRVALKLYTASDIVALGTGSTILPNILSGLNHRASTLAWPTSESLPPRWITIWETILVSIIQPNLRAKPLGQWIANTHQQWRYHTTADKLVITNGSDSYAKTTFTRSGNYTKTSEYIETSIPCDINLKNSDTIQYIGSDCVEKITDVHPQCSSHKLEYSKMNDWRKRNWGDAVVTSRVINKCVKLLRENNLVACSDGSVNFDRSAHAWGLACKRKKRLFFSGRAPVDGHSDVLNSTRAEILGIIACVSFIQWISLRENISGQDITIYTDSEASILSSTMTGLTSTKFALYNDIDVILELQEQLRSLVHTIHLVHVEAH